MFCDGCWKDTNFCSTNLSPRVADPGKGTGGARVPTLFLDQTEARKAEKNYFETTPLISEV